MSRLFPMFLALAVLTTGCIRKFAISSKPEWRLNNLVTQRRARWLLGRADHLFVE
jgi:hypothetical protein